MECHVDVAAGIEFRLVNLNSTQRQITGVVSNSPCSPLDASGKTIPLGTFLTTEALATMAAGSWQLLAENYFDDGWPATLYRTATQSFANAGNLYFNDSDNSLEDALGLASAIAMGDFYGTAHGDQEKSGVELRGGKLKRTVVRLGSGDAGTKILCSVPFGFMMCAIGCAWYVFTRTENSTGVEECRRSGCKHITS